MSQESYWTLDELSRALQAERQAAAQRYRLHVAVAGKPASPRMLVAKALRSLASLLDEFDALRTANLAEMRSWRLSRDQFDLTGVHPTFGRVTLRELLAAWVVHDLGHIAQTARVMAKQYRDAVGPWVPFMPVLTDHEVPRS